MERQVFTPWRTGHQASKVTTMKDHIYKQIELTGTSTISIEDAVQKAIKRAHKTLNNLSWFQIVETRGSIDQGKIQHWQVSIKLGFCLNE